jgi:endonuclease YncB( thermonuclease family)
MKMKLAYTLLGSLLTLLVAAPAAAREPRRQQVLIEARIVEVVSGDSMKILNDQTLQDLRIFGVAAPQPGEPMGAEARDFTAGKVAGRDLTIQVFGSTSGPVLFGDILLPGGKTLGTSLLDEGFAFWNHAQSADPELGAAEVEARARRKGIWISEIPVLGALFRQGGQAPPTPVATSSSSELDRIVNDILKLSDGDRARLAHRLGGVLPAQAGVGQTTLIIRETQPVYIDSPHSRDRTRHRPESEDFRHRTRPGADTHSGGGTGGVDLGHGRTDGGGPTVYADGRGGFHRLSCFGGGQPGPALSRTDALARGYAPCPQCSP